jgi:hypothetical protein
MFPLLGTSRCPPLPSGGFRAASSPPSSVLRASTTPPCPSRQSSVSLDRTVPPTVAEARRSPTFVGNPCESVPRASDSGGSAGTSRGGSRDAAFRHTNDVGIRNWPISELNPRGPLPCCLRFTSPVARRRCKTHYRPARYGVGRAGFTPAGFLSEVSRAHPVPPLPRFSWRDSVRLQPDLSTVRLLRNSLGWARICRRN